jgi:CRP-like cAMP-binding protein
MSTGPLSASDRAAFRGNLLRVAKLDEADLAALEAHVRMRSVPARTELLRSGERAVESGMVVLGLVREYYPLADGREVTRAFAGPGDYVGSLSDLLSGLPAKSTTVAEADTRLVVVPWQKMVELMAQRPAWAAFHSRITERLYLAKSAREYELLALDAEARYARFRERNAAIEPLIALRHVASYVGITPEHLSRLRRRLGIAAAGSSARSRPDSQSSGRGSRQAAPRPAPRRVRRPGPAARR